MADLITHTETFTLTGVASTVTLAYNVGYAPTITLDDVAQDVYAAGVDASGQEGWYWREGAFDLQWQGAVNPSGSLVVEYQSQLSNYVIAQELDAITANTYRSGLYEVAVPISGTSDQATAQARASAMLRRAGTIVPRVKWQTKKRGYRVGQVLTITEPKFNLTGSYIIESISATVGDAIDLGYGSCLLRSIEAYKLVPATTQNPDATQPDASAGDPVRPEALFSTLNTGGGSTITAPAITFWEHATIIFGAGGNIADGAVSTNPLPLPNGGILSEIILIGATAPVGQILKVDVKRNGISILKKDTPLTLAPGEANTRKRFILFYRDPLPSPVYKDDILSAVATYQTSATSGLVAASGVTVQVRWYRIG